MDNEEKKEPENTVLVVQNGCIDSETLFRHLKKGLSEIKEEKANG